jgi:hypothetical protein
VSKYEEMLANFDRLDAEHHGWVEDDDDLECTHCGGDGTCDDGCNPLWYDDIHTCHACGGTGNRRDQRIF